MTGRISGLLPLVQKYYIGNVKEMIELSGEREWKICIEKTAYASVMLGRFIYFNGQTEN